VTVKDSWHGRGIATSLLDVLVRHRPEGVVRPVTEVANENSASFAMLRHLAPTEVTPNGHGAHDVQAHLDAARAAAPHASASPDQSGAHHPVVPLVKPPRHRRPHVDRERHQTLQTRDLVCPWLN